MRALMGLAGLVGFLIACFIAVYMFADFTQKSMPAMKQVTNQANRLAGRSSNGVAPGSAGTPVLQDSQYRPLQRGTRFVAIQVVVMPPTNGLAEYYGLAVNDVILQIGPFKVGEDPIADYETAHAWIQEGLQREMELVIDRGGYEIKLPAQRNFVPPPAGAAPNNPAASPGTAEPQ
jgi:hypothetical protein